MTVPNLTAVRESHRFDETALCAYLERHQAGFRGPLEVLQFEGGQSNPTFLLQSPTGRYVLRKQPPGELLPSAHQVDREFRVMAALAGSDVPVPGMRCLCTDREVIGTSFYVMDHVEGRIFSDATLPGVTPASRTALYLGLARILANLHRVDPAGVGLADFGGQGNYFERQIRRWTRQYEAAATEQIEAMSVLMKWLPENIPAGGRQSIVHGDYRMGNCIVDPVADRIVAVLDWELSTIGDPLADLGYLCQIYYIDILKIGVAGRDLAELGIPTQDAFLAEYCRHAGIARVEGITFSIIYNLFRLAGISQGVYKRGLDGNASSSNALQFAGVARKHAENALRLLEAL